MLGLVAYGRRDIKDGSKYDRLFPKTPGQYTIVNADGNLKDTVNKMKHIIKVYHKDTQKIAAELRDKNLDKTCKNIFDFCYNHIQYKLDKDGVEELRRPARAWQDRESGIDCDCFSIFISSILTCLGIDHKIRITKYDGDWQHVYVVVPKKSLNGESKEIIIDPVLDTYDYQKPFADKMDYTMSTSSLGLPIAFLNGMGCNCTADAQLNGILNGDDFNNVFDTMSLGSPEDAANVKKQFEDSVYKHIVATRDYIQANPFSVATYGTAKPHLMMLNYLIENWADPTKRSKALDILEREEEKWNQKGLSGLGDLGKLQLFKKIKEGLKNVGDKIQDAAQNVGDKIKDAAGNIKDFAQKVGKGIVSNNPLALAARGGYLLAAKLNLFRISSRLAPAFMTEAEAKSKGLSSAQWSAAKMGWNSISKRWDKIGGKTDKLKEAIIKGSKKGRHAVNGLGSALGEAATATLSLLAAAPLIIDTYTDLKDAGIVSDGAAISEEDKAVEGELDKELASGGKTEEGRKGILKKVLDFLTRRNKRFTEQAENEQKSITESDYSGDESKSYEDYTPTDKSMDSGVDESTPTEDTWSGKLKTFVRENPVKATVIGIVAATGIAYAVSPKFRASVGNMFGGNKKALNGLGSPGRKRKHRASKKAVRSVSHSRKRKSVKKVKLK